MENIIYDIAIIGAGPAGMTAAIYAGRANKKVVIIDKNGFGGKIATSPKVENFPGFASISGTDLAFNIYSQMTALENVTHTMNEVLFISYNHGLIKLTLDDKTVVCSKSLIIATGAENKKLNLNTKDIYYCVTCDGPFFKNKPVIVVGSGNTGATYALELATYCKQVYLCDTTFTMNCEEILKAKVQSSSKITWLPNCTITSCTNNKEGKLISVNLSTYNNIKCNAIFAAIGMEPKTDIFKLMVSTDSQGYIEASENCVTNKVPGIFVAGDCRTKQVRQAVTAANDGATAAIAAIKFLNKN